MHTHTQAHTHSHTGIHTDAHTQAHAQAHRHPHILLQCYLGYVILNYVYASIYYTHNLCVRVCYLLHNFFYAMLFDTFLCFKLCYLLYYMLWYILYYIVYYFNVVLNSLAQPILNVVHF